MGKTGKWIRNFLLGKKEDKLKQIDTFCPENKGASSNKMVVKRRWSLRKLSSGRITGKVAEHNFSRSFDLDDSIKLQIQALLEAHIPRYLPTALAKDTTEFQNTAATKIQSAFRSYLARKALHALRGLVKLQAVVRGYLVRKQTSCTLRGMHALMSIQVRARINRIQMVEAEANANLLTKPLQHTQQIPFFMTQENRSEESIKNRKAEEMAKIVKSKSGGGLEVKSRKYGSMAYNYSKRLSVSKRENNNNSGTAATAAATRTAPNSPAAYGGDQGNYYCSSRDMNMMINDEESNSKTSMAALSTTTTTTNSLELEEVLLPHRQSPNYMNKTKSSKAKTRSRSEPKQRPEKQGSKSWKNINYNIGPNQEEVMLSNSSRFEQYWIRDSSTKRDSIGSSTDVTDSSYYYYY